MDVLHGTYKTIAEPSSGTYKDKGSKFLAFAFPVTREESIREIVEDIRKKYFDARHHCYAYRLGPEKKDFRSNDDGEPSGTAGKPILGQLLSHDLTDIVIVVVRYFGGTLLGTSGLIQAYKLASADALQNASIIQKFVYVTYILHFDYVHMNTVMKIIKDFDLLAYDQDFQITCSLKIKIKLDEEANVLSKITLFREITCKKTGIEENK